jgi:hypothetical protein
MFIKDEKIIINIVIFQKKNWNPSDNVYHNFDAGR